MILEEWNLEDALAYARKEAKDEGRDESDEKWKPIVTKKDNLITEKDAIIAKLKAQLQSR